VRITVFGAGAIGGFIAAALARSGVDICVVARGTRLDAIRRDGLRVEGSDLGTFGVKLAASSDLRDFGEVDYVLITPLQIYATANIQLFKNAQVCISGRGWVEDFQEEKFPMHVPKKLRLSDETLRRLDEIWPGPGGEAPAAYAW